MANIRKVFYNGKKIEAPIWNGIIPYALYYNGECVWKNGEDNNYLLRVILRKGYSSLFFPALESEEYKHMGYVEVHQNGAKIQEIECDTASEIKITGLNSSLDTELRYFIDDLSNLKEGALKDRGFIKSFALSTNATLKELPSWCFGISTTSIYSYLENIQLSNKIEKIGDYCFHLNVSLTHFDYFSNVWSVGKMSFYESSLKGDIKLLNATEIKAYAFFSTDITSVHLSSKIQSIGADAFSNCNSLTDIYYDGTIEEWENISFGEGVTGNWLYGIYDITVHCNNGEVLISGDL